MKLYAFAAVAALSVAAPATAQTVITLTGTPSAMSGTFGNQPVAGVGGAFSDSYIFTLGQQSDVGAVLTSIGFTNSTNIDFTSVLLNGKALTINNGVVDFAFTGSPINFAAGPVSLVVNGLQFGEGSYSGVIAAVAAVPEPATWAMMIGGFGMIGGVMRRRAYKTKVRFNFA